MLGVSFNHLHSFYDLGLLLSGYPVISSPAPRLKLVEVPGSDQPLDLSQALTGNVHYDMRTISMEFTLTASRAHWPEAHAYIMEQLHGQRLKITMDDDPEFYYIGRVSVGDMQGDKVTASIPITATVEPYRQRHDGNGRRL